MWLEEKRGRSQGLLPPTLTTFHIITVKPRAQGRQEHNCRQPSQVYKLTEQGGHIVSGHEHVRFKSQKRSRRAACGRESADGLGGDGSGFVSCAGDWQSPGRLEWEDDTRSDLRLVEQGQVRDVYVNDE